MSWWKFRNALQKLHLWIGLTLSIPFVLIGVSGSIIIAINWLPDFRVPFATASGEIRSINSILEAANKAAPEGQRAAIIRMPQGAWDPARVQLAIPPELAPEGARGQNLLTDTVFIDPRSLEVLGGEERRRNGAIMRVLTQLHLALMFPSYYGGQTVGWMGVAMCLFGLSGLILWWPRKGQWRSAFVVKRGTRGFRLNRDLHGVIGFWSLPVFMILSISGVYLVFPSTFGDSVEAMLPQESTLVHREVDAATIASIPNPDALTADDAAKLALAVVPGVRLHSVQLPPGAGGVFMVNVLPLYASEGAPLISAFVGPGAEVSAVVDPRTDALGTRILAWLKALHYGFGLGFVWKLLAFLSGFLPLLFAITGFLMWQGRRARRRTVPDGLTAPAPAE
jgi:uncharacterized iron-regulated membrane protein